MISNKTYEFLQLLAANNQKEWFDKNRDLYQLAKLDFEKQMTILLQSCSRLEPALKDQNAKDCVFRIFRDVRFSKDKTPYKPNFGAYLCKGGKKWQGAGYYFHFEPQKCFCAGGIWMPEAPILKKIRQEIDYNWDAFNEILNQPLFIKNFKTVEGEKLQRPPKGYDLQNPALELLKMKTWIVKKELSDSVIMGESGIELIQNTFALMQPFVDFLNRVMD